MNYEVLLAKALPYYERGRPGDVEHIRWLVRTVTQFLPDTELDPEIVMPLVILHDIGYARVPKDADVFKLDTRTLHMEEGANMAKELLGELNYPPEKTKEIVRLIAKHDNWALGDNFRDEPELEFFQNSDYMWMVSEKGFDIVRHLAKKTREEFLQEIEGYDQANLERGQRWYNAEIEAYYCKLLAARRP